MESDLDEAIFPLEPHCEKTRLPMRKKKDTDQLCSIFKLHR